MLFNSGQETVTDTPIAIMKCYNNTHSTLETFYTETFEHRPNQTLLNIILLFYCQLVATNENIPCRHCLHNDNIQSREACSSHNNQYGGRRAIGGNMWDSREIVCHKNNIGEQVAAR